MQTLEERFAARQQQSKPPDEDDLESRFAARRAVNSEPVPVSFVRATQRPLRTASELTASQFTHTAKKDFQKPETLRYAASPSDIFLPTEALGAANKFIEYIQTPARKYQDRLAKESEQPGRVSPDRKVSYVLEETVNEGMRKVAGIVGTMLLDPTNLPFLMTGVGTVRPALRVAADALMVGIQQAGAIRDLNRFRQSRDPKDLESATMQQAFALIPWIAKLSSTQKHRIAAELADRKVFKPRDPETIHEDLAPIIEKAKELKRTQEASETNQPIPETKPVVPETITPPTETKSAEIETKPTETPVEPTPIPTPEETIVQAPEIQPTGEPVAKTPTRTALEEHNVLRQHPVRGRLGGPAVDKAKVKGNREYIKALGEEAQKTGIDVQVDYLDKLEDASIEHAAPQMLPFVDAARDALLNGDYFEYARQGEMARNTFHDVTQELAYDKASEKVGVKPERPLADRIADRAAGQEERWGKLKRDEEPVAEAPGEIPTREESVTLKRTPAEDKLIRDGVEIEMRNWAQSVRDAQEQLRRGESASTTASNVEGKAIEEAQPARARSVRRLGAKEGSPVAKFKESPGEMAAIIEKQQSGKKLSPKEQRIFDEMEGSFDRAYEAAHLESIRDYLTKADEQNVRAMIGEETPDPGLSFDFGDKLDEFEAQQKQALKDVIRGAASGSTAGMALPVEVLGRLAAIGAVKLLKGGIGFYKWAREMRIEVPEISATDLQRVWDEARRRLSFLEGTTAAERKKLPREMIERIIAGEDPSAAGKLVIALERASTARMDLEAAYTAERKKRFAKVDAAMRTSGGEQAHFESLRQMKGEMAPEKKDFTPLDLTDAEANAIYNQIHHYTKFQTGQRLAAADGFRQVRDGRVPKASQIALLGEIFGRQFAIDLARKSYTFWDTIIQLRNVGLLSGVKTHVRNIGGNAVYQLIEEVARIPAATTDMVLSQVVTGARQVRGSSPAALKNAFNEARTKGVAEAKEILKTGTTTSDLMKMDMTAEVATGIPWLDAYGNLIVRSMAAEDRVFKSFTFRHSLEEVAWLEARKGDRSFAEIMANPGDEIIQQAIADAEFATFNNPNIVAEGLKAAQSRMARSGLAGKAISSGIDLVVPFKNTPANIIARVLDYSGGGFAKAGYGLIKSAINRSMTPELQKIISQGVGRGMTGAALITIGYMLAQKGLATGITQTSPGAQNADQAAGRLPAAILLGDKWHTIGQFSPAGNLIAIGATLQRESNKTLTDEAKRPGNIAAVATRTVMEQPMLKGTKDIIEALRNPASSGERFTGSMAGSFVPTVLADVSSLFDPYMRDSRADSFLRNLTTGPQSRIPGLRNLLPPRIDILGDEIKEPSLIAINPLISMVAKEKTDKAIKSLVDSAVAIGNPNRQPGESTEAYRLRYQMVGKFIKLAVDELVNGPDFDSYGLEDRREALEDAITQARRDARAITDQEFTSEAEKLKALRQEIQNVGR